MSVFGSYEVSGIVDSGFPEFDIESDELTQSV